MPLQQVAWGVNEAGATNEIFGIHQRPWGGSSGGGFDGKTSCLSTGANFLHPSAPGCSGTHGGDTSSTPRVAPAPRPHCGDTLPPGDHCKQLFGLMASLIRPCASPHPIQDPLPRPSPPAGTVRVCPDLMSILDIPARSQGPGSGHAAPHRPHRRGFHSPTV